MSKTGKTKFVLPRPASIPFELPPSNHQTLTPRTPKIQVNKKGNKRSDSLNDEVVILNGEEILKEDLSYNDYRNLAEYNGRNVLVRKRATEGISFEKKKDKFIDKIIQLKKTDLDLLKDEKVLSTFGWLLNLETSNTFLRILSINRRSMAGLALFYNKLNGDDWYPLKWPTMDRKINENTLPGLTVTYAGVTEINLRENNLVGIIPREFANGIHALIKLDLSRNKEIEGPLPPSIGLLEHLEYLNLSQCNLSGYLPLQLCLLFNLKFLDLSCNSFIGELQPRYVDLIKLEHINFNKNKFEGKLPRSWSRLKHLKYIAMAYNQLYGTVPDEWENLKKLEFLDIKYNQFNGPVPNALLTLLNSETASSHGEKTSKVVLQECRLRGNDWDSTIIRYPHGILLNASTDLALVDLPGTPYMTSKQDARRLLHKVTLKGDILPSPRIRNDTSRNASRTASRNASRGSPTRSAMHRNDSLDNETSFKSDMSEPSSLSPHNNNAYHETLNNSTLNEEEMLNDEGHCNDLNMISGGASQLLKRSLRPPTATSPRVVASVKTRYQPLLRGGEKVINGFQALYLEPAPLKCESCDELYSACLCVTLCQACGQFSKKILQNHHQLSKQVQFSSNNNENKKVNDHRSTSPKVKSRGSSRHQEEGESVKCRWCGLTEKQGFKYKAAHSAYVKDHSFNKDNVSNKLYTSALLYPPKPIDLLNPPTSHSMDVSDPYSDHFPF